MDARAAAEVCTTTRLLPHGGNPGAFVQCDAGGAPMVKTCPEGTAFKAAEQLCDFPQDAGLSTAAKAGTAKLSVLPLGVTDLNADITYNDLSFGVTGLPYAKVTFTSAAGKTLCTATADLQGHATCDAGGLLSTVDQLLRGYTGADRDGDSLITGSTAKGTIVLL
ncbi:carbohydrate-binding module family 14 protein [Streptomyces sp. NPDC058646]|uniref:carbohydrate-binding module family 14 protein n=1 Tax=Streptomyces sp. NPDC058646 TaxID=3346574 RepID=UPI0036649F14